MFKLINGIYYSEHNLNLDNNLLLQEVIDSRNNPEESSHYSRPHSTQVEKHHTFYEDTNLYDRTYNLMDNAVMSVINGIFGQNMMQMEEIWGHIIPPNEQTMIHDHGHSFSFQYGLSWVYYPHTPLNSGGLCFMCNIDNSKFIHEVKPETGKLFLFSNYISHFTPRNASNVDRISISGNAIANTLLQRKLYNDVDFKNPFWKYHGKKI